MFTKKQSLTQTAPTHSSSKNVMQYISYQQPPSAPNYAISPQYNFPQHSSDIKINRNAYLYPPKDLNKDNKQLLRNHSHKETGSEMHESSSKKIEGLKMSDKSKHSSNNKASNIEEKSLQNSIDKKYAFSTDNFFKLKTQQFTQPKHEGYRSPSPLRKTVDLGDFRPSNTLSKEGQLLSQRLQYLMAFQQQLNEFQMTKNVSILRNLNQSNRLQLIRKLQQINHIKELGSVIDHAQSENMSEDAYSVSDQTQTDRNGSVRVHSQKGQFHRLGGRSREKSQDRQGQLAAQIKLNQKLQKQYAQFKAKVHQVDSSALLDKKINMLKNQFQKQKSKNQQIIKKLLGLPFFNEWNIMCQQYQGAKKTKIKLKEQIQKRKACLKGLRNQGKQEGSEALSEIEQSRKMSENDGRNSNQKELKKDRSSSRTKLMPYKVEASRGSDIAYSIDHRNPPPALPRPISRQASS